MTTAPMAQGRAAGAAVWPGRVPLARAVLGWALASATTAMALGMGALLVWQAPPSGQRGDRAEAVLITLAALPAPALRALPAPAPQVDAASPDAPAPAEAPPEPEPEPPQAPAPEPARATPDAPAAPQAVPHDAPPPAAMAPPPPPPKARPKPAAKPQVATKPKAKAASKPKAKPKAAAQAASAEAAPRQKPAKAGAAGGPGSAATYDRAVLKRINATKRRAAPARGTVVVGFRIAASGAVAEVSVVRGSGSGALDAVALDHIRRAGPFPPPPKGARRSFSFEFVGRG